MQRSLAGVVGDVDICTLLQEEGDSSVTVADRARDHQWCPAGVVRSVDVGFGPGEEELHNGEVVVCQGPVDGEAVVFVAEVGEFWVSLGVAISVCLLEDE